MKTYKIFIVLLAATFSACSLDEKPIDFLGADTFYTKDNDVVMSINGCYESLKSDNYYGNLFVSSLFASADYGQGNTGQNSTQQFTRADYTGEQLQIVAMWAAIYKSIGRVNTTIYRTQNAPGITDELKNRILGEARFIRALNYFNLVRSFGEVPLRVKPVENFDTDIHIPVSKREEIYKQIVEDLKFAELNCWNRNETRNGIVNNIGRATSLGATTLLAKVYLHIASSARIANTPGYIDSSPVDGVGVCETYISYTNYKQYYDSCLQACNKGIAHSDFALETDWKNLWNVATNKNPKEYIFSIQSSADAGYGNRYPFLFLPRGSVLGGSTSSQGGLNRFVAEFVNVMSFDTADYRWKSGFVLEINFRNNTPAEVWKFKNGAGLYYGKVSNTTATGGGSNRLAAAKWNDPATADVATSRCEFSVLRSVDLYLMKGEAQAEITEIPADGYSAINTVRSRVAAPVLDDVLLNKFAGANQMEKFREFIMKERLMEFAAEGDRWFTLLRMGKLITKAQIIVNKGNANKKRVKKNYYWPISQEEINSNNMVNSNSPGY